MSISTHSPLSPALLAEGWLRRFVNRASPYAVQHEDGSYKWLHEEVTSELLAAHLRGELTVALASADAENRTRWVCLDIDVPNTLGQLAVLGASLEELGVPNLVEESRRGGHLWVFFAELVEAHKARSLVAHALTHVSDDGLEIPTYELYPRGLPGSQLAQAVRLPLGVHHKSGQRYPLWHYPARNGRPLSWSVEVAAGLVLETAAIPVATCTAHWAEHVALRDAQQAQLKGAPAPHRAQVDLPMSRGIGTHSEVIRWVDAHVDPRELLAELAPESALKRRGQGYLGWCPFHDDRAPDALGRPGTPSFYVVRDRRYGWSWKCFSTNCAFSAGPMKHPFRLLQELLELSVAATIRTALARWPEAAAPELAGHHATEADNNRLLTFRPRRYALPRR